MSDKQTVLLELCARRLKDFVKAYAPGQCRWLSKRNCSCPLCDIDELLRAALAQQEDRHE